MDLQAGHGVFGSRRISGLSIVDLGTRGKDTFTDVAIFSAAPLGTMRPSIRGLKRDLPFRTWGVEAATRDIGGRDTTAWVVSSDSALVGTVVVTCLPQISPHGRNLLASTGDMGNEGGVAQPATPSEVSRAAGPSLHPHEDGRPSRTTSVWALPFGRVAS